MDEVHNLYKKYRAAGDEGVMLKDPNGIWEAKRVKHQVKFKGVYDADLMCVGWEPGTKKNDGKIGAYLLESDCGKMKVSVGTGLSDKDREADPQYAIGKIIAIQYNDIVKDKRSDTYSLFLPRFLEVREDKETADTLEDLIKQAKEED
jgi:ATP-dependent DNA ligase